LPVISRHFNWLQSLVNFRIVSRNSRSTTAGIRNYLQNHCRSINNKEFDHLAQPLLELLYFNGCSRASCLYQIFQSPEKEFIGRNKELVHFIGSSIPGFSDSLRAPFVARVL